MLYIIGKCLVLYEMYYIRMTGYIHILYTYIEHGCPSITYIHLKNPIFTFNLYISQECSFNKQRDDTWLRLTWNGNMRVTNCEFCCMRWYFTINGDECSEPGMTPFDAF